MLSTRTYSEFIAQVGALCMKDFSDKDETRIATLGNLAAKRAYKESQWWERWLVASEPRSATRGRVDASEDSYYVFGAGDPDANGLYVRNGDSADGKPAYTLYDSDGTTALRNMWSGSIIGWYITISDIDSAPDDIQYTSTLTDATPPSSGWNDQQGESPAPLVTALADIDTYMLISSTDTIRDSASRPIRFYVDSSGANLRSNAAPTTVWVTYKKTFTDVYGDGTSGTTSDIPSEWFNYMTLYSAYMYQSAQRQNNPSQAFTLALREVEASLEDELIRLEDQHITDNLAKNIYTHQSQNQSLI